MNEEKSVTPQIALQRLYLKDLSFESPSSPEIFRTEFKPTLKIDLKSSNRKLDENHYEVVLEITITAQDNDTTIFVIEVEQAGLFYLEGFEPRGLDEVLGIFCPSTIFPYLRETVDNIAVKGSLPPLALAPINFEHIYHEARKGSDKNQ